MRCHRDAYLRIHPHIRNPHPPDRLHPDQQLNLLARHPQRRGNMADILAAPQHAQRMDPLLRFNPARSGAGTNASARLPGSGDAPTSATRVFRASLPANLVLQRHKQRERRKQSRRDQ